jgi:Bacterial Ig domain
MLVFDLPAIPPPYAAIVLAESIPAPPPAKVEYDRTVGVCQLVRNPAFLPGNPGRILATNGIGPGAAVVTYFRSLEHRTVAYSPAVTLLEKPHHGQLRATSDGGYVYLPDTGYFGIDSATFQVSIGGMAERVLYTVHVVDEVTDDRESQLCPKYVWRIRAIKKG